MLKNEFYELDPISSIVVSYEEIPLLDPHHAKVFLWKDALYQATVRYITTRKCLTVKSVQIFGVTNVKQLANVIVAEMQTEYLENKGSKL